MQQNSKNCSKNFPKNEGIAFIFLDPSETHLQSLYHGQILGGSWPSPTKCMVAVLGTDIQAKPIQIVKKSIKSIKEKSYTIKDFAESLEDMQLFMSMKNPIIEFLYKNIIVIPIFLTKAFIQLEDTSPFHVAKMFVEAISTLIILQIILPKTLLHLKNKTMTNWKRLMFKKNMIQQIQIWLTRQETWLTPRPIFPLVRFLPLRTSLMVFNFVICAQKKKYLQSYIPYLPTLR